MGDMADYYLDDWYEYECCWRDDKEDGPRYARRQPTRYGELSALIIHQTAKAWLVRVGEREIWLPKSKCNKRDGEDKFGIPEWLVEKTGIDQYVSWS